MGFLTQNPTQSVNPNSPQQQALQADFATFLQGLMGSPNAGSGGPGSNVQRPSWANNGLAGRVWDKALASQGGGGGGGSKPKDTAWVTNFANTLTSDLQRQSLGGIGQYLNQPSPEVETFKNLSPGLMDIFGLNTAEATGAAAMPLFQQGLQFAQGQLANSGRGRFSTTFENQGIGLSQRALQDFNLLQQQAFQQNVGNRLGAASLLGTLSGQAGQAPFDRLLAAGNLGLQATASNPILQLLLGGMNFASPAPNDTVVGKSWLDHLTGAGATVLAAQGGR